jgi:hypothetical protein
MKITILAFVFHFILRCWPKTNIIDKIKQQYGYKTLRTYRKLEKILLKINKVEQDIQFMVKCKTLDLIPKFCRIKLPNQHDLSRKDAHLIYNRILDTELTNKRRSKQQLSKIASVSLTKLRSNVSFLCYLAIRKFLHSTVSVANSHSKARHAIKIKQLLKQSLVEKSLLDSDKIVVNLSSYKLSDPEVRLLSKGLQFSIPPHKLDRTDVMTSFETLFSQAVSGIQGNLSRFKVRLKSLCYSYIHSPPKDKPLPNDEMQALEQLAQLKDLVFIRPDKGNGIVVMNCLNYINKMNIIISDPSKFTKLQSDPTQQREQRLQRFLLRLYKDGSLDQSTYTPIRPSGSTPSQLYCLPKVHKKESH